MDLGHPPLHFPFYGVDTPAVRPRWLAAVEGRLGHPATGVWLRHGSLPPHPAGEPWLLVGTLRGGRSVDVRGDVPIPTEDVAADAVLRLLDVIAERTGSSPDGEPDRVVDLADREGARHAEWPRRTWTVAGTEVRVPVLESEGGWAGFARDLDGADLVVLGGGVDPDRLVLTRVVDGGAYGFDPAEPIRSPQTLRRSRARALGAG